MDWDKIKLPANHKVFKVHHFTYLASGSTYKIEVDEGPGGLYTGHGEHSTDPSQQLKSVSGSSIEECLQKLVDSL